MTLPERTTPCVPCSPEDSEDCSFQRQTTVMTRPGSAPDTQIIC